MWGAELIVQKGKIVNRLSIVKEIKVKRQGFSCKKDIMIKKNLYLGNWYPLLVYVINYFRSWDGLLFKC